MNRMKKFVDSYELKENSFMLANKLRAKQKIANVRSGSGRTTGDVSKGQGLAGDTIGRLQNREQELAAMIRRSLLGK